MKPIVSRLILSSIILSLAVFGCEKNKELPSPQTTATLLFKIQSALGEGAFWNAQSGEWYWVDIEGQKLHIFNPVSGQNRSFSTPSRIGTVVPTIEADTAIIALEDGIYKINTLNGDITLFSPIESDMPVNRFNDGKCDPSGRFWVGSMNYPQNAPTGSVYMVESNGKVTRQIDSVTISNGIVWNRAKDKMYYIDTPTGYIAEWQYDDKTGAISNQRIAVKVPDSIGFPDGMAIDAEDKLWVGLWNGGVVARFDPVSGELMSTIEVPAHNVTSCAFGGQNLDTLFITTASLDMTEDEKRQYPDAGSLFFAIPGVTGVKSPLFGQ